MTILRIATRKSPLALWQAEHVSSRLQTLFPDLKIELVTMSTKGDRILDAPLAKVGGKGLFVKELEQGMLEGRADIAVHSMKDVPVDFPEGLFLAVILEREDPGDALVSNHFKRIDEIPHGAVVGTSSLRRQCQLRELRPDLELKDLRGNVNTRLAKLDEGQYEAIVLASAGLKRLGMADRIAAGLKPEQMLPAIGQGAIGIECREGDDDVLTMIQQLQHADTASRVLAERAMNDRLAGGCQVPIAGHAILQGDILWMRGLVGSVDGKVMIRVEKRGHRKDAEKIGFDVAEELLANGAGEILAALKEND